MKRKIVKISLIFTLSALVIGSGVIAYFYYMPQRNVQNSATDFRLTASELVNEYLENSKKADAKYLDEEGDSKIIEVKGEIKEISDDYHHQKVVLLKGKEDRSGVSCTFMKETNMEVSNLKISEEITIKGVIRSGATFDADLDMYENVIVEKSSVIHN